MATEMEKGYLFSKELAKEKLNVIFIYIPETILRVCASVLALLVFEDEDVESCLFIRTRQTAIEAGKHFKLG